MAGSGSPKDSLRNTLTRVVARWLETRLSRDVFYGSSSSFLSCQAACLNLFVVVVVFSASESLSVSGMTAVLVLVFHDIKSVRLSMQLGFESRLRGDSQAQRSVN